MHVFIYINKKVETTLDYEDIFQGDANLIVQGNWVKENLPQWEFVQMSTLREQNANVLNNTFLQTLFVYKGTI